MNARMVAVALTLLFLGCQPQQEEQAVAEQPTATPSPPDETGDTTGVEPDTTAPGRTLSRVPPESDTTPIVAPTRQTAVPKVTVRELIDSDQYVGKRVRVDGRCLGYGKPIAVGPPPLTRSDWQLEADGVAIYVSGPLPGGCSATEGSDQPTTIFATVAEDTLPSLGNRPTTPRRYLVRIMP